MKILTKEEEAAHYNATLKGGISGGAVGLLIVSYFPSPICKPPKLILSTGRSSSLRSNQTLQFNP